MDRRHAPSFFTVGGIFVVFFVALAVFGLNQIVSASALQTEVYPFDDNIQIALAMTRPVTATVTGLAMLEPIKSALPAAGTSVNPGDTIVYLLSLTNMDSVTTTAVTVEDNLSALTSYVNSNPTQGVITQTGRVLTWNIGEVAPGASVTAQVEVLVNLSAEGDAEIRNNFQVFIDGVPETFSLPVTHTVNAGSQAYLPVIMIAPTVTPTPSPTPIVAPVFANPSFEDFPDSDWAKFSEENLDLIVSSAFETSNNPIFPRTGDWMVWLGGRRNEVAFLYQDIFIPSGFSSIALTYWYIVDSGGEDDCSDDIAIVTIDDTPGSGIIVDDDDDDDDDIRGDSDILEVHELCEDRDFVGWRKNTISVTGYAGRTVRFYFASSQDGDDASSFFLDDVGFEVAQILVPLTAYEVTATPIPWDPPFDGIPRER